MKKIIFILFSAFAVVTLSGCQGDEALEGEGQVSLKVMLNNDVSVISRSSEDDLANNCTLYIYNSESLIRKYHGVSEVPSQLTLVSGDYKAVAWAGDSVAASFTEKYYKGVAPFTITKGSSEQVNVQCKIANTVASVVFDTESLDKVLTSYKVIVGSTKGTLEFDSSNAATAKGYYMMPSDEKDLTWTITGTKLDGSEYSQNGVIPNVKKTTEYVLNVSYSENTPNVGGALLTVTVDTRTLDIEDQVTLKGAPKFFGSGFDINEPFFGEPQGFQKTSIYASSVGKLKSVELSCSYFTTLGLPANSFDLLSLSTETASALVVAGLSYTYAYDQEKDQAVAKMTFSQALLNKLPIGSYQITMKATDNDGKYTTKVFTIEVSTAMVMTLPAEESEIHQYTATIHGSIVKSDATNCGFNYRVVGNTEWSKIAGTVSGNTFSAKLSGLTPGAKYQFVAICDGFVSSKVCELTMGLATPLENGGFENWFTDTDGALVPSASANGLYWDSGNHGSMKMKINITTKDTEFVHGGSASIKLASDYPSLFGVGKFAAGNVFIGKYLATDGTNGILGFGRSFTAKPKALHGYVRYNPGKIDKTNTAAPGAVSGQNDKGIIYIALMDGTTESYSGSSYPMVIKTKTSELRLFSQSDPKVLAYGEKTWSESTGDGWIEFTIPLDYKSSAAPVNILVVASASYWGDYFAGSTSSVMWLDDLELIYQ